MYRSHYLGPFPREQLSIRETQKRAKRRDRHEQGARDNGPTAQAPREPRLLKAPHNHLDHGRPTELARAGKTGGGGWRLLEATPMRGEVSSPGG